MYSEDDLLPLSGLQHLLFCERRCALVLIEGAWSENVFTAEGHVLHERAHQAEIESRGDLRIVRGLRLRSLRLGLAGIADVVEFHRDAGIQNRPGNQFNRETGSVLDEACKFGRPFPVEYKRGHLRREAGYEIQLCAQALCLEEMLAANVPAGAIFFGAPRRRLEVTFASRLRTETESAAARLHELVSSGKTPLAKYERKCDSCSLFELCLPKSLGKRRTVEDYLLEALNSVQSEGIGE